jgi:hypothetical protein
VARMIRPDKRWDAGVGTDDGKPGSSDMEGRSLAVDQPSANRDFQGSEARRNTCRCSFACGEAAR